MTWLFLVMLCYLYNSTVIPLRAVFPYQTRANWSYWLLADYFSDLIYIVDVVVFKTRLRFTSNGCVEVSCEKLFIMYLKNFREIQLCRKCITCAFISVRCHLLN